MRTILWSIICVLLLGCTKTIYVPVVRSSSVVDTVVRQEADSSVFRALFECDSTGKVLLKELSQVKGRLADQTFDFADNQMVVQTRWQTKFVERMVEVRDTVSVVQVQKEIVPTPYIPKFFWGCFIVALLAVGWICYRILK